MFQKTNVIRGVFFTLVFLPACPSWATITLLQSGPTTCNSGGAGATTLATACTFGSSVASGSLIVVAIREYNTTVSSVTGTRGETFATCTLCQAETVSGGPYRVKIYFGTTTSAGTDSINFVVAVATYLNLDIYEFNNIAASPLDQSASSTSTTTVFTQTVGPTSDLAQADELVFVASITATGGVTWAAGTTGNGSTYAMTILQQKSATVVVYGADEWAESSGTGAVSASFTTNNSTAGYAIALATFRATTSASPNMMPMILWMAPPMLFPPSCPRRALENNSPYDVLQWQVDRLMASTTCAYTAEHSTAGMLEPLGL